MMKKTALFLTLILLKLPALAQMDSITKDITLNEVVATGTRNIVDSRILPMTVSVLGREILEERGESNILPSITERVPGLFITQRGVMGYGVSTGSAGGIKCRGVGGTSNTDMLVLIDGMPHYAGLYGHSIADNYQTMMAERVEIIRGPASMLYGSNAMGGVINIVTRKQQKDTVISEIHIEGGSYYTLDAGATNQVKRGKFTSAAGINYSRTDGHRKNMNFDEYSAYLRLGYEITNNWSVNAMGDVAYFNSSNPGTVTAPIEDNDMHILRGNATLSIENSYNKTSGAVRVFYNGGKHKIDDGYAADGGTPQTSLYCHTDFMAGVSVYQSFTFYKGNRTTFGFDYQQFGGHAWNERKTDGSTTDIISKTQYTLAGYADFRQQIVKWLSIDAGIRFDWHNQAGIEYIPQGGLSFLFPANTEIKALVSRGFRNPTIKDLYMYRPANAELKAESLWNYEISYKQKLLKNRLVLNANIFYLHATNLIETQMIDGKPKNVNTGEMNNAGCEFEVNFEIIKGLFLNTNYSYLYMKNPQPAAPEHKLNVTLTYHHERFHIGTNVQYINGLYLTTGSNPDKESYVLWNAHIAYRIWRGLWVNIKADNLLAWQYETIAGFPMPRTTIMGGVKWGF